MDIETISLKDFDNIQIPIVITLVSNLNFVKVIKIDKDKLKIFIREKNLAP
jgi:hypothetical protein